MRRNFAGSVLPFFNGSCQENIGYLDRNTLSYLARSTRVVIPTLAAKMHSSLLRNIVLHILRDYPVSMLASRNLPCTPPHCSWQVMLALCTHRASFVCSPETLPDVLDLFTSSLVSCHVSARVMRLQCLSKLVESFGPGPSAHAQFLPSVTLEVVLCTKDSNARTRELVYNVLVLLAIAGGNPADTVRSVVAGLAANTPHARSAAVLALGHLQLEFGHFRSERWDARVADILPELTRTMLILLKEPSREVVRAVLGWLRVAIGGADRELLRPMIGDIVQAVMSGTTPRHKVRVGVP